MDDLTLLRRYVETSSEEDFRTLVARHIDHVYSVAARETGDPQLAQDVTQATFIILARKAGRIPPDTVLSGWLFRTARFAARNARRGEVRRQIREQEAADMNAPDNSTEPEAGWQEVSPLLNDALASLSETDRAAVLLRFFEKKAHDEIATALGTTEVSARKRLSRALDRLRHFFVKRGVPVTNASLLVLLSDHAVQSAPPEFARSLAATASASAGLAAASISSVVEQTLKLMAWTKLKTTTAAVAGLLLVTGTTAVVTPVVLQRGARETKFPDGTTFALLEYEFTDRFDFRYQSGSRWWQRATRTVLPGNVANSIVGSPSSGRIVASSSGGESLFLATLESGPRQTTVGRLQVLGDDGSVSDGIFSAGQIVMPRESAQVWQANPYPRRARELTLRFFGAEKTGWRQLAEFVIDNPVSGPFPDWQPEPVPATRKDGDLSVTLLTLETGVPYDVENAELSSFWKHLPATRATFAIRQVERERTAWTVRNFTISDATGNEWSPRGLVTSPAAKGEQTLETTFLGALWPGEPAWKFRLELSQTNDFAPHELLKVTDIPVPESDGMTALNNAYEVNGAPVHLEYIGGPDAKLPRPYEWSQLEGHFNIAVKAEGRKQNKRFTLVEVWDDRGRAVEFTDKRAKHGTDLIFGLKPAAGAQKLSFIFAMHESRFVEFLARPKQMAVAAKD